MRSYIIALLSLASCEAVPDEIQVQTTASQYDYLGGDSHICLKSMDGESYGGSITAIYKLKPTRVQIVESPAKGFIDDIRESTKDFGKEAINDLKDSAKSAVNELKAETLDKALDDANKVIQNTIQSSQQSVVETIEEVKEIKMPDIQLLDISWTYLLYLLPIIPIIIVFKVLKRKKNDA